MKKKYKNPELEIIAIDPEDVIRTSGEDVTPIDPINPLP